MCKARSAGKILLFMSILLGEFSVKLFRKNKKRKALTMQLALCPKDIKIYYGWRVTFKATQQMIELVRNNAMKILTGYFF